MAEPECLHPQHDRDSREAGRRGNGARTRSQGHGVSAQWHDALRFAFHRQCRGSAAGIAGGGARDDASARRSARQAQGSLMCNLYKLNAKPDHLRELMRYIEEHDFPPRTYVSPGSPIAIVRAEREGLRHLGLVRWGFVPSWAKEIAPGKPLTNARSETILEKASFKNAI